MSDGTVSEAPLERLDDGDVVVCVGPGGVGKTTVAAALALRAARSGRRVALLTVDPARRLADALGLAPEGPAERKLGGSGSLGNDPRRLDADLLGVTVGDGELWAVMLDVTETFDGLIHEHARDGEQARRVLTNRLYRNLTTSLSGTHEYMAAERLRSLHLDDRFDLVVVDTPPSHHALDLLDAPGRLARFVDHRLYRSLLAPRSGIFKAVNAATQAVARVISQLVGSTLLADVTDFFAAFEGMDRGFHDRAAEIDALLAGPRTRYVAVTAPLGQSIEETGWLVAELGGRGRSVEVIVANRVTPDFGWVPAQTAADLDVLDANLLDLARRRDAQLAGVATIGRLTARSEAAGPQLVVLDEQDEPVHDGVGLAALAAQLG